MLQLRPDRAKKKLLIEVLRKSLRGSQVARLGQRCCFVIVVKIRVSCAPSPSFPLDFGVHSFPRPGHVCPPLVPSRIGRGWKARVGQRPVGPTGLQARKGPVLGWRWGWYRARLGVPAPGASMIGKEIPPVCTVGSPSMLTPPSFSRPPFLPPWDERQGRERGVCSLKEWGEL